MAFPNIVRSDITGGFVGDIVIAGEVRAQTGVLKTANTANNIIGRVMTHVTGNDGEFVVGGTGVFAGILSGRNQMARIASGNSTLESSLVVPNNVTVEGVTFTAGIMVELVDGGGAIGDAIAYKADGTIVAAPGGTAPAGTTLVPDSKIVRFNIPAAGLAVVQLTN